MATSSTVHSLLRYFPPPSFMRMRGVGIDMTDRAIKHLLLNDDRGTLRVATYGFHELPEGAIEKGAIKDPRPVVEALRAIRATVDTEFAYISLPEDHAYLFITAVPGNASHAEIRSAVELTLKENVPISPTEAVFDFSPLCEVTEDGSAQMAVSVYPAEVVSEYAAVLQEAGFMPLSFEIEGGAASRSVIPSQSQETVMLVDMGRAGAGISIVNGCSLAFTSTLEVCGDDLTRAISRSLNVSYAEAEKLKIEHGFIKTPETEAIFSAVVGIISALRDEILKHLAYWQVHSAQEYSFAKPVSKIVLVGGNTNIKGFREYLAAQSPVPVVKGNVWANVASFDEYIPPIHRIQSYRYATAIGLALRGVQR